ncbi:hypothetical protein [Fodinicola feengrottensis]|uniref:hypothetical protein n=1 Tax=Fodinicola feengrottensis TaxID=435914 RepID=UPI0013D5647C|nr:hypothetical protein [Fodinicola feengrottensis]
MVAFVHEPPCDTGGSCPDVVLDQNPATLEFYQRAMGAMLGFSAGSGPYCVMGADQIADYPIARPAAFAGLPLLPGTDLFRTARRVSAATLYRHLPAYRATVPLSTVDEEVTVVALGESSDGKSTVAVCPVAGGEVTVEYRTANGDDLGVVPAVVVHSLGVRPCAGACFEAALPPIVGAEAVVAGVRVQVLAVPGPDRITICFTR